MLLAAIAALMFVIQTLCLKKLPELRSNQALFGLITTYSALIAVGLLLWQIFVGSITISTGTWTIGSLYGVTFTLTMFFYTRAMNTGPLSYSSFYFSVSLMVPVVASMTLWREAAGPLKIIGLVLFLLSFYFIQIFGGRQEQYVQQQKRWMTYCLLAFLFNGLIPVLAKTHQSMLDGSEATELMIVGFSAAFICSFLCWIGTGGIRNRIRLTPSTRVAWSTFILISGIGLSTGVGNALMVYLANRLPGAYLYPFVNGSMIVLLTLVSTFVFKEKLTKGGALGILVGILAIIAVNL